MTADLFIALACGAIAAVSGGYLVIRAAIRAGKNRLALRRQRNFWKQPVAREEFEKVRQEQFYRELDRELECSSLLRRVGKLEAMNTSDGAWRTLADQDSYLLERVERACNRIAKIENTLGGSRWESISDEAIREGVCWSDALDSLAAGEGDARVDWEEPAGDLTFMAVYSKPCPAHSALNNLPCSLRANHTGDHWNTDEAYSWVNREA